jgi:ribosome-binding factor A
MTLKQERMDQILQREISKILQFELKNPKLGFVTVTDVQCTRDMSQAKVFVSFLGKQERNDAGMRVLRASKGFIRSTLAKNVKARKIPDLIFVQDTALEKGRKIDSILNTIDIPEESPETENSEN